MRIFGKRILFPIMIHIGKPTVFDGRFGFLCLTSHMSGSYEIKRWIVQYRSSNRHWEVSIVWRWQVSVGAFFER